MRTKLSLTCGRRGVTVIEVVVLILALIGFVLAIVAIPSYMNYQRRVHPDPGSPTAVSERAVCEKAGFETPTWRMCGGGYCFYCADAQGRLFPVVEPPCNAQDTSLCADAP